ncbi:alcohol dehydrogenase [Paenarthrobacter sp. DKR-5]|uniref:alcohol dehydrogenase n=1 Tax=Paenarthrobacter sp. DKR-5 TaxID=2835535 RepID=UPI001BDDC44F|nr:alcohol dehydrogenase [Paenarthrobacter sp. DKR-5]MBT1000981.1 alcohol dehydrogenase [Paenarthrobacter sp. DKR-5]
MRAVQITAPGASLELVERPVPDTPPGHVLVKVAANGICHSDAMPGAGMASSYPRVPGHEIAGTVEAVGEGVARWAPGQRVGVGWFGGACFECDSCSRGDFVSCQVGKVTGLTSDGGYAEYLVAPADALAAIPDNLDFAEAAPLLCAGVTTFNGIRSSGVRAGGRVAVVGLGGLGHLGVQFSAKLGFETISIARGSEKEDFARRLGAEHYIDSTTADVAAELKALGGADLVLATVTDAQAMSATIPGLAARGRLVVLGVPNEPLAVNPADLVMGSRSVAGHASGTAKDSEDTLRFAARTGVRPMIETYPLEKAAEGYDRMISGKARFRVVLTTD